MKNLLVPILIFWAFKLTADIPRVDLLKVSHQDKTYYTTAVTSHLEFREGCVFDAYKKEYLYEQEDFFEMYYNSKHHEIELHTEAFIIPFSRLYHENIDIYQGNPPGNIYSLEGNTLKVKRSSFHKIEFLERIVGNSVAHIASRLTKQDLIWIYDYPMEVIASFSDFEMCHMELISIKGNVSKAEADKIKNKLQNLYKAFNSPKGNYKENAIEKHLTNLLKRNIFMIGYCSC